MKDYSKAVYRQTRPRVSSGGRGARGLRALAPARGAQRQKRCLTTTS